MDFKNKKAWAAGGLSIALLLGSGFAIAEYQSKNEEGIKYIDGVEQVAANEKGGTAAEQTKKLNDEEGIDAEQIVVKITDEGYVTSHGDHFHYYSGKVPFDALISEELIMNDPSYTLKQSDIVSEHKAGFIIKVNGQYYLYLKNPNDASVRDVIRTKEEILEQRAKVSGEKGGAKGGKSGSIFSGSGHRNAQGRYTTDDGYVFTPGSIVQDTGDAYIVAHGDHFHFVPKADLSPAERAAAQAYLNGGGSKGGSVATATSANRGGNGGSIAAGATTVKDKNGNVIHRGGNSNSGASTNHGGGSANRGGSSSNSSANKGNSGSSASSSNANLSDLEKKMDAWYKLPQSKRHVEKDGLVFDPRKVTESNSFGYVIPHGDHFHIIPFNQLTREEIEAADAALNAKAKGQKIPSQGDISKKQSGNKNNNSASNNKKPANKPSNSDKGQSKPADKPVNKPAEEKPAAKPSHNKPENNGSSSNSSESTHNFLGKKIPAYGKGVDGKPYVTDDGYTFSKDSIVEVDNKGVTASHGDHYHYFGYGELEQSELDQVADWIKENNKKVNVQGETITSKPSNNKPQNDRPVEDKPADNNSNVASDKDEKPAFDVEKVIGKKNGKFVTRVNGKEYTYDAESLDNTQRAFAELKVAELKDGNYKYDVVAPKGDELEPGLYVNLDEIPMHAENATIDLGDRFIIPHIDHIHIAFYKDMTKEQIATVKYLMQHPDVRPDAWTSEGHEEKKPTATDDLKYIVGVTPKDKRNGMKNWQIVHDIDEVKQARKAGRYATNDGYIFDAEDIRDPQAHIYKDSYTVPRAKGGLRDIPFTKLSDSELKAAKKVADAVKAEQEKNKDKEDKSEQSTDEKDDKKNSNQVDFPIFDPNKPAKESDDKSLKDKKDKVDQKDEAKEEVPAEESKQPEAPAEPAPVAEQPAAPAPKAEPTNDELKAAVASKYGVSTSDVKLAHGQWEVTVNGETVIVSMAEAKQLV